MLRNAIGGPPGLRLGVCGVAASLFILGSEPAAAAPYADFVLDANSGTVLHETNADARRHPASLTKIMTLYLLFEQLEAGKLKLESQLKVSKEAAGQSPTKLGLKPGSTLAVEDAIKGMVTRSANDAAVVVAEAIAGDEDEFAKLMTRKAQALGMTRTVYRNASGLPNDEQVTTARDQATLGRAVQERFPRYYKYFSTRSFTFRGQSIGNHNHLLGRVEGVDGIKTGYISASGFNLVTSVHRGNRYLVAVVLGGSSAGSRDARMRELISDKIARASTKRTAPMIAEAASADRVEPKVLARSEAKSEARPEAKTDNKTEAKAEAKTAAKSEGKPDTKRTAKSEASSVPEGESKPVTRQEQKAASERRFAVASTLSVPAGFTRSDEQDATAQAATASTPAPPPVGSTEPIRPVLVRTLTVRAPAPTTPSASPLAAPLQISSPAETDSADTSAETPATTADPAPVPTSRAAAPARIAAAASAASSTVQSASQQPPAASAGKPQVRSGWIIQVGAYHAEQEAKQRLSAARNKASKMLTGADAFTETFDKGGTTYYRARFAGLDKDRAEAACKYLKKNDVECVAMKN
jgi:D-alanyl-D-alanine carboxypeptidase